MKTGRFWLPILLSIAAGSVNAKELSGAELLAQAIYADRRPLPLPSSQNYTEVLTILREAATGRERMIGSSLLSQGRCLSILIDDGDQPTIDYFMDIFLRSRGKVQMAFDVFRETAQPMLIPQLAKALSDTDFSAQVVGGDVVFGSFSGMSARGILHIVSNSEAFQFLARATASHYLQHIPNDRELIAALEKWWQANRDAFARQAYMEVTPLPEIELPRKL